MKIIADAQIPFVKEYFLPYGELILKSGRHLTHADVKAADILLVRSITRVNEALLSGSSVKFVGSVTSGVDHLDTAWLEQAGIQWGAAQGFNAPPVADYVVAVVAFLQKHKLLSTQRPKAAVIGVGNVGRLVVDRLKALGFDVIVCDPIRSQNEKDFQSVPLDAITNVDLISLHVPLTFTEAHATYHFINKVFLERQKPGCILLNASRGAVIHSEELIPHGQMLPWCFDVWEHEPNIDKTILERALIATPHIAGYSVQSKIRGIDRIYHIACNLNVIQPQRLDPLTVPKQELSFAGGPHAWQDVVLGIFNPAVLTEMMRTVILPATDNAPQLFDDMRHRFNYRHEFAFTSVKAQVEPHDRPILESLGIKM